MAEKVFRGWKRGQDGSVEKKCMHTNRTGPRPDVAEFQGLVIQASRRVRLKCIIADAGYDSESNHAFARDEMDIRTIIPALHGRPTDKPAKRQYRRLMHYRRLMQTRFNEENYRKRAQVETVMSMIKRRQGSFCRGRTHCSRCRELHLMALTHNIMILWRIRVFCRAAASPFLSLCPAPLSGRSNKPGTNCLLANTKHFGSGTTEMLSRVTSRVMEVGFPSPSPGIL
jgi:hypothetical protein